MICAMEMPQARHNAQLADQAVRQRIANADPSVSRQVLRYRTRKQAKRMIASAKAETIRSRRKKR